MNYTVSVVMEIVAYGLCLLLMDRIGRRAMFCLSMLVGGVACLATIFTVLYAPECKGLSKMRYKNAFL